MLGRGRGRTGRVAGVKRGCQKCLQDGDPATKPPRKRPLVRIPGHQSRQAHKHTKTPGDGRLSPQEERVARRVRPRLGEHGRLRFGQRGPRDRCPRDGRHRLNARRRGRHRRAVAAEPMQRRPKWSTVSRARWLPWATRLTLEARPRSSPTVTVPPGVGSRSAPSRCQATTSTSHRGPRATTVTSETPRATRPRVTTPTTRATGTLSP